MVNNHGFFRGENSGAFLQGAITRADFGEIFRDVPQGAITRADFGEIFRDPFYRELLPGPVSERYLGMLYTALFPGPMSGGDFGYPCRGIYQRVRVGSYFEE